MATQQADFVTALAADALFITDDDMHAYLGAKGGGNRKGSGKGHGRRRNPCGRDGAIMKCRICNSEEHVAAQCTQGNGAGTCGGAPPPTFHTSGGQQAEGRY